MLSCLAAMQGAILLIAAKRSDQVAAELAQHDYDTDSRAEKLIEALPESLQRASRRAPTPAQIRIMAELTAAHDLTVTQDDRIRPVVRARVLTPAEIALGGGWRRATRP